MIGLEKDMVKLVDHDPSWKMTAIDTIEKLKEILAEIKPTIEHVGSTAIVGIKAKPIIDIAVAVDSFKKVLLLEEQLNKNGFFKANTHPQNELLFACGSYYENKFNNDFSLGKETNLSKNQTHFIHFVLTNSMEWVNYINFKNYLNTNQDKAKEYENIKDELSLKYPEDRKSYTSGKEEFIKHTLRKALVWSFLGKLVTVKVDRPVGYINQKEIYALEYPINYGYIEGVIGGDGEELDVYIYGESEPIREYFGRVIAIVHREDGVEDKLVVAQDGLLPTLEEVYNAIEFQEKYYNFYVEMCDR